MITSIAVGTVILFACTITGVAPMVAFGLAIVASVATLSLSR